MAACISSEFATVKNRGLMMGLVFSMQGLGTLTGILVSLVTLAIWKVEIQTGNVASFDHVWRICVVFCVIPALATLYFRLTLPESPRYTLEVSGDVEGATRDAQLFLHNGKAGATEDEQRTVIIESKNEKTLQSTLEQRYVHNWSNFKEFWSDRVNVSTLIGTAGPWFLVDLAVYVSILKFKRFFYWCRMQNWCYHRYLNISALGSRTEQLPNTKFYWVWQLSRSMD